MIVAAYFLLIRPQQQRQKRQAEMLSQLQPGAEILTVGGIFATVVEIGEDRVRVAVADGAELEIVRGSIQAIVAPADETSELDDGDDADESEPPIADEDESEA